MQNSEDFKQNILSFSSEKLCQIIAASRYLNSMQEEAYLCMIELANRRSQGNDFKYEEFIDQTLKEFPKFNLDIGKMMTMNNFLFKFKK